MKKYIIYQLSLLVVLVAVATSCKDIMDVANENNPDFAQVYASGEDLENLASGLFNTYFRGSHRTASVQPMLATAADNVTCSWGNFGMQDLSWEPRNFAWVNTPTYNNQAQTYTFFNDMYAVINTASNVLRAIEGGVDIDGGAGNARVQAVAKLAQGIAYANLALIFDKTWVVDEHETVESELETTLPYADVAGRAVGYMEEALAIASANSFTIPETWFGTGAVLTNAQFVQLINTYIARTLAYLPRNNSQLLAVDWNKVRTHADAGIDWDLYIVMDGFSGAWYSASTDYLTYSGWGATDMYVVHLMDPTQPQHWTDDPAFPHPPPSTNPIDERLITDFEYMPSNWMQAARGYYHFTNHRSKRYDDAYVNATLPLPELLKAENDMLKAESRIYGGSPDLAGAAAIINASTRKTRGQMPDVLPEREALIQAIHHERHVELYAFTMGVPFFEMRKLDLLQIGTPLHFPLPARTLETLGLPQPYYTFGTVAQADGINTSNGGWR